MEGKYYMHSVAAVNKNGLPLSETPTEERNLTGKPLSVTEILRPRIFNAVPFLVN